MDRLTEAQITGKMEVAIMRGTSQKYPLLLHGPAKGNTLELEFEGIVYQVTVTETGKIEDEEDEDGDEE
jgi:hypothetical protein